MSVAETLGGLGFVTISGGSIAKKRYPDDKEKIHLERLEKQSSYVNLSSLETKAKMSEVLSRHQLQNGIDLSQSSFWQSLPWKEKKRLNSLQLFGFGVCFADLNAAKIPDYIIPPKEMVFRYYGALLKNNGPLFLHEQLDQALDIVGPHPTAAAILLLFATRVIARDQETKILGRDARYVNSLDELQFKVAGFNRQWVKDDPPDPTGNTYYFWTNVAMSMLLRANGWVDLMNDLPARFLFPHGPTIMSLARDHIAGQPNPGSHKLPSRYGLQIGGELANTYLSPPKP